jgi:hypothetical protein
MSWLFSQALVEEFSEAICLDGEQSVQLSGNNTPQAYCAPDKMTGFSRLSRFGMTYKPLMENRGEELLTLYREGFLAKTSQPLGGGLELMENEAECGEKWQGSFVKFNPDLCSWKTHQFSLLGDLDEFLETWPKWGLMRNGECWAQTALDYPIGENEFGCWLPTPVTSMWRGAAKKRYWGSQEYRASFTTEWVRTSLDCAQYFHPDYAELLMDFPDKWTELKPLEMHKYQEWRQPPGES